MRDSNCLIFLCIAEEIPTNVHMLYSYIQRYVYRGLGDCKTAAVTLLPEMLCVCERVGKLTKTAANKTVYI